MQAQQGKVELVKKVEELENRKANLKKKEVDLKSKKEAIEKRIQECKEIDEQRRNVEKEFLKHQHEHLNAFMKSITEPQIK